MMLNADADAAAHDRFDVPKTQRKRSKEEVILLMLCALSIPSILPFGVYRLMQHNWLSAALDLTLVAGMLCVMLFVRRSGRVKFASIVVTIFYSVGMLATVYIKGVSLVYWVYPTMIAAFFMLRPIVALAINGVSLIVLIIVLAQQMIPILNLLTIVVTIMLINLFSYIFSHRTGIQHKELNREAERDFLTGVGNRRALARNLATYAKSNGTHIESSLLLLDLDHFKTVNDRFGHAAGDAVLVHLCELIRSRTRTSDQIFRYGGEEFIVIAKGASLRSASGLAEDLRALVASTEMLEGCLITISIGVASMLEDEAPSAWLQRADRMLYLAKQSGRNAVRVAVDAAAPC
jgi:diguanylate cyclase (GGDEF)-like protein